MKVEELFSRRHGFEKPETLWEDALPEDFMNGFAAILRKHYTESWIDSPYIASPIDFVIQKLGLPQCAHFVSSFVDLIKSQKWHMKLTCVELLLEHAKNSSLSTRSGIKLVDSLAVDLNYQFELKNINWCVSKNYRLERRIENLSAIETALQITQKPFDGAREHLKKAWEFFNKRPEADEENCVKEAVAAVESAALVVSGIEKGTLKDALRKLEIHPALREAMNRLYGYRGDETGVAHAGTQAPDVQFADAELVLTVCSAIVTYLVRSYSPSSDMKSKS